MRQRIIVFFVAACALMFDTAACSGSVEVASQEDAAEEVEKQVEEEGQEK